MYALKPLESRQGAVLEGIARTAHGIVLKAAVMSVGALVEWDYRGVPGYGRVEGYDQRGNDHATTNYRLHVFYRHRSADGTLEPATRMHWGTNVHTQPKAKELARAEFEKFKGTKQEGVLSL